MPTVWIIQKPHTMDGFDMEALEKLGEVRELIPSAPNLFDQERISDDLKRMTKVLMEAKEGDIFIPLGGSPLSHHLFGAAFVLANKEKVKYGLYSRSRDRDGIRGASAGSYRIVDVDLGLLDCEVEQIECEAAKEAA